jgi:hypothetical protein
VSLSLARGYLPIPKARWNAGDGIEVQNELTALIPGTDEDGPSGTKSALFLYKLQLFNESGAAQKVSAFIVARPYGLDGSVAPLPDLALDGRALLAGGKTLVRFPFEPQELVAIPPLAADHPPSMACRIDLDLPAVSGEYAAATPAAGLELVLPAEEVASWPERKEILKRYALTHVAWSGRGGLDAIKFRPPDSGLADTYRAALAQLLLAASPDGVGRSPFAPESFSCLETAAVSAALNRAGRSDAARLVLESYAKVMGPDGRIPSAAGPGGNPTGPARPENNGRALFSLADHLRFSNDAAWLAGKAAVITAAADFLAGLTGGEQGRLPVPPAANGGEEPEQPRFADGFWTLIGLEEAAFLCRTLGLAEKAGEYESAASALRNTLESIVAETMEAARIYHIPAGPRTAEGQLDPAELPALGACAWPGSFVTYDDAWARRGFEIYWERWFEASQGGLEDNDRFIPAGMELGPPILAMRRWKFPELILDWHAKHMTLPGFHLWADTLVPGGEAASGPMSYRAAAAYVTLMRSIFLMETADYVFIAPGVSLRWFDLYEEVSVQDAVTPFGRISYRITTKDYMSTIDFLDTDAAPPRGYMMNQFYPTESPRIRVDGKPYIFTPRDFLMIFPRGTKKIEIDW